MATTLSLIVNQGVDKADTTHNYVVQTNVAHAAGSVVGGTILFQGAMAAAYKTGKITNLTIKTDGELYDFTGNLWLFNVAVDFDDADAFALGVGAPMENVVAIVPAANWEQAGSTYQVQVSAVSLPQVVRMGATANLWGVYVVNSALPVDTGGTPTTGPTNLYFTLGVEQVN